MLKFEKKIRRQKVKKHCHILHTVPQDMKTGSFGPHHTVVFPALLANVTYGLSCWLVFWLWGFIALWKCQRSPRGLQWEYENKVYVVIRRAESVVINEAWLWSVCEASAWITRYSPASSLAAFNSLASISVRVKLPSVQLHSRYSLDSLLTRL